MKYSAVSLLFSVILVLLVVWQLRPGHVGAGAFPLSDDLAPVTRSVTIGQQEQQALALARQQLQRLQGGVANSVADAIPPLIETRPPEPVAPRAQTPPLMAGSAPLPPPPPREYRVSMIFVGQGASYAVIDGSFAREGETLPGGARIESIGETRVVLRERGERRTLRISGQ